MKRITNDEFRENYNDYFPFVNRVRFLGLVQHPGSSVQYPHYDAFAWRGRSSLTKASTMAGSNWVPAPSLSSSRA